MDVLNYCRVDVCIRDSAPTEGSRLHVARNMISPLRHWIAPNRIGALRSFGNITGSIVGVCLHDKNAGEVRVISAITAIERTVDLKG